MTYFDLRKPSLAYLKPMYNCNGNIPDKVALKAICIKHVTLKIVKIRTGCQYIGYFNSNENLNCTAKNFRLGHMRPASRGRDTAVLVCVRCSLVLRPPPRAKEKSS